MKKLLTFSIFTVSSLIFFGFNASADNSTLDTIRQASIAYISGAHESYTLATEQGEHTNSVIIGGTTYYYTPDEDSDAKNTALINLANTGMAALVEGDSGNYVFYDGSKYWKYDTTKLPVSIWAPGDGDENDYDYKTYTVGEGGALTPVYNKFSFKNDSKITWTETDADGVAAAGFSFYDVANATTGSFSGNKLDGAIRFKFANTS